MLSMVTMLAAAVGCDGSGRETGVTNPAVVTENTDAEAALSRALSAEEERDRLAGQLVEMTERAEAAERELEVRSAQLGEVTELARDLAAATTTTTTTTTVATDVLEEQYRASAAANLGIEPSSVFVIGAGYPCLLIEDVVNNTEDAEDSLQQLRVAFGVIGNSTIQRSNIEKLVAVDVYCPDHFDAMYQIYLDSPRFLRDGTYEVGQDIPAGTYRITGHTIKDCYWERTAANGNIIDNNYITAATDISVTARDGELFTSERCGSWDVPPVTPIVIQRVNG